MSGTNMDNFSDSASNMELLEKAKNEFNREKRLVIKNLPFNTTEKEIRAFMGFNGEFPVEDVSMVKYFNQAIVTLKEPSLVEDAIAKLNGTKLEELTVNVGMYRSDKMLCVAHLPTTMTEYQFRSLVAEQGTVEKCFLMRSEKTGESKSYGFVEYNEPIEKVGQIKCSLDWLQVEGQILHCDAITDSSQAGIAFQDLHSKCLVIDNLPPEYKDSIALREVFSSLVKPVYCQIVTKEGESLGFGIIEYDSGEDAELAYNKFQGHKISGVAINLSYCIPGKSAVHMFNRIMFKYGDKVQINRASLLPDPVYPNPAFLKHVLFKTHVAKHPRMLVQFTDSLLHLQEGYVKQLEDKTNAKPGILGPPPTIPMSPLMDVNLQLGLLTLIVLDMRERGVYNGEVAEPMGKLRIPTEEEFQQKPEPVSLLGDPMTAQGNIILKNLLMPADKADCPPPKVDPDEPRLLGRPIRPLNFVYLCSLGRMMAMLSDRSQSLGILGSGPNPQSAVGPKPLIEGLMQAGKMAQSLLNTMSQQNQNSMSGNNQGPNHGNPQSLMGNAPNVNNKNNNNQAATNFMSTIQALAFQKLSESKDGNSQILNALFGNTMEKSGQGAGLLGSFPGPQGQNQSSGGKPKSLLNMNMGCKGDGLMPTPPPPGDEDFGFHGSQGGGSNYDDSGYQAGYESDFNEGFNDNYGGSQGDAGYGNYDNRGGGKMGMPGNKRPMGNRMMGPDMNQRGGSASDKFDGAYFSGINDTRPRRHSGAEVVDKKGDYNRIAQQAAAYAAGAAAAYKRQYEEYMAQAGYGSGYSGGYDDDTSSGAYTGSYRTSGNGRENTAGYDNYSSGSYSSSKSSYGSYDYTSTDSGYSQSNKAGSGMRPGSGSVGYDSTGNGSYGSSSGGYSGNSTGGGYNSNNNTGGYNSNNNTGSYGSNNTTGGYGGNNNTTGGYSGNNTRGGYSSNNASGGYGSPSGGSYSTSSAGSYGSVGSAGGYGSGSGSYSGAGRFSGMGLTSSSTSNKFGSGSYGSMRPPLPPGPAPGGATGLLSTPQGQKRASTHILPSPEPSPEGDYIGQHSQGIGGHYADTYAKRQRLTGKFSY